MRHGLVRGVERPVSRFAQGTIMICSEERGRSYELLEEVLPKEPGRRARLRTVNRERRDGGRCGTAGRRRTRIASDGRLYVGRICNAHSRGQRAW